MWKNGASRTLCSGGLWLWKQGWDLGEFGYNYLAIKSTLGKLTRCSDFPTGGIVGYFDNLDILLLTPSANALGTSVNKLTVFTFCRAILGGATFDSDHRIPRIYSCIVSLF